MLRIARTIGVGYLALALLVTALKAFVPLGALGYAPFAVPLGPGGQPIEVVVWYGTEKQAWLEEAARRFEASGANLDGRPINVRLVGLGSREIAERVAARDWRGEPPPAAISPASNLWVELLRSGWAASNGGEIVDGAAQPLVLTPLVAVAWEERGRLLWPDGGANFWQELGAAVADEGGWASVAARRGFAPDSPEAQRARGWSFVKFGHTSPLSSNSGTQTIILLAYAYHNKTSGLTTADILDPGFLRWLETVERSTLDFGESTGSFMTSMVQFGPSRYDVVMVYENLAIQNMEAAERRWGQPIRVYYPPATMFSDHPFATLGDPLTDADTRAAAARFRDFLRSRPLQELALSYGFRPADPRVSITGGGPDNPFTRYASYGVRADIDQEVETPSGEVVGGLIDLWRRQIEPLTVAPRR